MRNTRGVPSEERTDYIYIAREFTSVLVGFALLNFRYCVFCCGLFFVFLVIFYLFFDLQHLITLLVSSNFSEEEPKTIY